MLLCFHFKSKLWITAFYLQNDFSISMEWSFLWNTGISLVLIWAKSVIYSNLLVELFQLFTAISKGRAMGFRHAQDSQHCAKFESHPNRVTFETNTIRMTSSIQALNTYSFEKLESVFSANKLLLSFNMKWNMWNTGI